jgi:NAD(P)-dependent dehydrogenase (short-subunit alcohol dehydrogenase family)
VAYLYKKNVLITGAGRGIGKRLALGFSAAGARIGLLARSQPELDLTQLEIEQAGGSSLKLRADIGSYQQVRAAVERMQAHFGDLDIMICAAAAQGPIGPVWEVSPKAWNAAVETNLLGVLHACRAVLPRMVERRSGKILVLGGCGAAEARPNFSAYAASKAGVVRLVETIADEVREHNVQINCIGPGPTYTHMTDMILKAGERAGPRDREEAMRIRSTGGTKPEPQLALAQFLASEESNHVSGKLIRVSDDWTKLLRDDVNPALFTLRRVQKI